MDPVARARAIAARLAATAIPNDALGKRKSRWEVRVLFVLSISECVGLCRTVRFSPCQVCGWERAGLCACLVL